MPAKRHGMWNKREYLIWQHMKARCYRKTSPDYKNYGARGIKISQPWLDKFENFYNDMGDCPEGFSIERIDNNKDYSKSNCKWASRKEQARNRRTSVYYTHDGVTKTVAEWAEILNIKYINLIRTAKRGTMDKLFRKLK